MTFYAEVFIHIIIIKIVLLDTILLTKAYYIIRYDRGCGTCPAGRQLNSRVNVDMADYIIVLAVAIMVFSIASIFIFARGKFVEEDGKPVDTHSAKNENASDNIPEPDDPADDSITGESGKPSDSTPHNT